MEKEGEKMLKYLSDDDCLVLLDLRGDPMSSEGWQTGSHGVWSLGRAISIS